MPRERLYMLQNGELYVTVLLELLGQEQLYGKVGISGEMMACFCENEMAASEKKNLSSSLLSEEEDHLIMWLVPLPLLLLQRAWSGASQTRQQEDWQ